MVTDIRCRSFWWCHGEYFEFTCNIGGHALRTQCVCKMTVRGACVWASVSRISAYLSFRTAPVCHLNAHRHQVWRPLIAAARALNRPSPPPLPPIPTRARYLHS